MLGQIGTDEAGYGPNLGPLTVTGTLWANGGNQACLYDALDDVIAKSPSRRKNSKLAIADSKVIYKSSGSIAGLEKSVLSFLLASQILRREELPTDSQKGHPSCAVPRTIQDLIALACPDLTWSSVSCQPGFAMQTIALPLKATESEIMSSAERLARAMTDANIRLQRTICRPVFATQFNNGLRRFDNKATLLSETTLDVVADLKSEFDEDLEIVCDKHGGRSHYASLIQNKLTNQPVSIGAQTRQSSDYFFSEDDRDVAIHFKAGGESFMPTAFASMVSKYVREVLMTAWNQFWIDLIPSLKPTKGYPVDAKRFKAEIAQYQLELGIADHDIWRQR
jgi:ribonuclease HII